MADTGSQVPVTPTAPEFDTSENAPLLQEEQRNEPPPAFNSGYNTQDSPPNSPPPAYSEQPPPYTPPIAYTGSAEPSVICRVCQQIIYIRGREQQRVVKCANCQEATPIKPPPSGKKYIRCPCNALLTCKVTSTRISCPRPNCKRIINLTPRGPGGPSAATVPGIRGRFRVTCGHCNEIFVFHSTNHLARCAHCRRVSSVGPRYAKTRGTVFAVVGLLLLAAGAGVTIGTFELAKQSSGIYVVWIGAFIAGILNLIRSCYYCTMTVSHIEGDV
ncbi:type 2 phosphatidylinositol 4,5-bisphosphate 4-phosphatase [Exaiptasia diaphana]|uniref:Phosphatidylinositol-4,5-bisphosphate 4-phosphatase n=1 Tax=Exaiptasia diaphana TaxID=2652724 RepID=A0A913XXI6_EXADI|nr:type 2 phosphatidylinositol 4,5-bisphosphate 4-phosphatase [Exaiptasia diaphana]KXJ24251.1 Type 1 phosphatidylinositol 4,5-bisphosphate 4-phosphatase [Exaiptasia diaphana]